MNDSQHHRSDVEAEKAVLGALLIDPRACASVAGIVKAADFYAEKHRRVFQAIGVVVADGGDVDVLTVSAAMDVDPAKRAAAMTYLSHLLDETPHSTHVLRYARIVSECAHARAVTDDAAELQTAIRDGARPDEIHAKAQALARKAEPRGKGVTLLDTVGMCSHLSRYQEIAADARKRSAGGLTVPTPWEDLNRLIGGGWRGSRRPYIVGAQEKVGKSQIALKSILHAARIGIRGVFFSLELPHTQVTSRILGLMANVSPGKILDEVSLNQWESDRVMEAWTLLQSMPIHVDAKVDPKAAGYKADPAKTVSQMRAAYDRLCDEGKEPGLIALDYAQKAEAVSKDERTRYIEISEAIADWATSISAPIIELVQCLSRGKEQNEPPTARDIFGTSQFAKDASTVIIADRPPLRKSPKDREFMCQEELDEAWLIVDIEEYGNTGRIPIRHDATCGNWLPILGEAPMPRGRVLEFARQDLPPEAYELQGIRYEDE